jgi:hypothetical protein
MNIRIRLSVDLLTGLLFVVVSGIALVMIGTSYPIGNAARMGAGFFPMIVSGILSLLGLSLIVRSFVRETESLGVIDLRPLVLVLASTLFFGLAIEPLGLPLAGIVLVFGARLAGPDFRIVEVTVLALGLVAAFVFLFAYALGMNLPHTRFW